VNGAKIGKEWRIEFDGIPSENVLDGSAEWCDGKKYREDVRFDNVIGNKNPVHKHTKRGASGCTRESRSIERRSRRWKRPFSKGKTSNRKKMGNFTPFRPAETSRCEPQSMVEIPRMPWGRRLDCEEGGN